MLGKRDRRAPEAPAPLSDPAPSDGLKRLLEGRGGPAGWQALADALSAGRAAPSLDNATAEQIAGDATSADVMARWRVLTAAGRHPTALVLQRRAWRLGATRSEMIALTFAASGLDAEFRRVIAEADQARDRQDWDTAASLYHRALHFYPLHGGYHVQYAHMQKERQHWAEGESHYRTAAALEVPVADVGPHLGFVMERQGLRARPLEPPPPASSPMAEAPTVLDVETLARLFIGRTLDGQETARLMRTCATVEAVGVALAADPRFAAHNPVLLDTLRAPA